MNRQAFLLVIPTALAAASIAWLTRSATLFVIGGKPKEIVIPWEDVAAAAPDWHFDAVSIVTGFDSVRVEAAPVPVVISNQLWPDSDLGRCVCVVVQCSYWATTDAEHRSSFDLRGRVRVGAQELELLQFRPGDNLAVHCQ